MPKIIGIDLGTTNYVAAIVEANKIDIRKMKNLKEFLTTLIKFILRQKNARQIIDILSFVG
jgi:molecular chaperone DnaK (HSP70)